MQLSKRLQMVADQVLSGGVLADIGCDHGFTSIYLVSSGRIRKAIAMDVREGPLRRAAEHVADSGMSEQIELRLSDGTDRLQPGEADSRLISGMGGALMEQILRAHPEVTKATQELVLSPQSEVYRVRTCLHELGFRIAREDMVQDMGKYYVALRAVPGKEHYSQAVEYTYGRDLIQQKHPIFLQYMQAERHRVANILAQFPSDSDPERLEQLQQEAEAINLVLELLGFSDLDTD